jgi:hypothetical protein
MEGKKKKKKKVRVKLVALIPEDKFFVATTKWEEYSLLGGVIENLNEQKDQTNKFDNVLKSLEREVYEETSRVLNICFEHRYISINNGYTIFLKFNYLGCFHENDTYMVLIYIPLFTEDVLQVIKSRIYEEQVQIFNEIFDNRIDVIFGHNYIESMDKGDYSFVNKVINNATKELVNKIKDRYSKNWFFLEKTGVKIITQKEFFDYNYLWEWKRLNPVRVKEQIYKLLNYNKLLNNM